MIKRAVVALIVAVVGPGLFAHCAEAQQIVPTQQTSPSEQGAAQGNPGDPLRQAAEDGASAGENSLTLGTGLGFDSNIYNAPSRPYRDYYDLGYPQISPLIYSGKFLSAMLNGAYVLPFNGGFHLDTKFKYEGRYYLAERYQNANVQMGKGHLGARLDLGKREGRPAGKFYLGGFAGRHRENYVDNDTGMATVLIDPVTLSSMSLSNRYNYTSQGAMLEYRQQFTAWDMQLMMETEVRDYEDPMIVSQYDHHSRTVIAALNCCSGATVEGGMHLRGIAQDYSDRPARDRQGNALNANARLSYRKRQGGFVMALHPFRGLTVYTNVDREYTEDMFMNYNDSVRDVARFRIRWRPARGWLTRTVFRVWREDYPNAFAFDNPLKGPKRYNGTDFTFKLAREWKSLTLYALADFTDQNSTDLRYQYQRWLWIGGGEWTF